MTDTAWELFTAKFVAAALLSAASFVGLLAPFWFFRFLVPAGSTAAHQQQAVHAGDGVELALEPDGGGGGAAAAAKSSAQEPAAAVGSTMISFANCVSAGILLWTGQMHFFVESASSFASPSLCPMAQASVGGSGGAAGGLACMEYAVGWTSMCFICGILIPLIVERVIWPWATERMAQTAAVSAGTHHHSDDSIAASMVAHAHSHGHAIVVHPPAKIGRKENGSGSRGSTPTQSGSGAGGKKALASAILIAILMSVHSATEGVAVGVEPSTRSLRASVSPLVVHKMFDGWLVGIGAYRTADAVLRSSGTLDVVHHLLRRAPQRYSLWIWLAALPVTLMAVASVTGPSLAGAIDTVPPDGGHYHPGATFSVAVAQATSSGSFLYVAVCAILLEEMVVTDAHNHNHQHHTLHQHASAVKRNIILLVGCIIGLMLGSVLSSHE